MTTFSAPKSKPSKISPSVTLLPSTLTLARGAAEISLADIVEAIDGPISLTHCGQPGVDCCGLSTSCQVKPHWAPVNRAVRDALSGVSLAELAPEQQAVPA